MNKPVNFALRKPSTDWKDYRYNAMSKEEESRLASFREYYVYQASVLLSENNRSEYNYQTTDLSFDF